MARNQLEVSVAKIETRLHDHLSACERRYQEGNDRLQRMFEYIKDAHEKTGNQIEAIQTTLAEQRGAGKMGKLIAHAATGLISATAAVMGGSFIHK